MNHLRAQWRRRIEAGTLFGWDVVERGGDVLLWRGVGEWGSDRFAGFADGVAQYVPYERAEDLLADLMEEWGSYGSYWGDEKVAKFYASSGRGNDGLVIAAWWPKSVLGNYEEIVGHGEEGIRVPPGTVGRIEKIEVVKNGQWVPLPFTSGLTITAAFGDSPEEAKALEDLANTILEPHGYNPSILPTAPEMYGGLIQEGRDGRLYVDGEPVTKLYRIVHPEEWAQAQRQGYLQSNTAFSPGYTRASAKPDERWRYQSADSLEVAPKGITLEIDYDPADRWHASAEGYAATHSRIPMSRVHKVGTKTAMPWTEGPYESDRCTQSVLMQFGIFDKCPKNGLGVLEALMSAGWTYRAVEVDGQPFRGTVKQFYDTHPTGRYYIASSGHAMALIEGLLVDSEGRGPDGRRIIGAFEVYRKGDAMTAARVYYHGSDREFQPGDLIRPQHETGAKNWAEQLGHDTSDLGPSYTGEHVHHSDTIWDAQVFGRHVYEVKPLTPVETDPESDPYGPKWTRNKGSAQVIRRVEGT